MVVRREKKRRRGERTYHGSHKKWRGKGSRGGRGRGGSLGPKLFRTLKYEPESIGKVGFKKPKKEIKIINIDELVKMIKEKNMDLTQAIDLKSLGYNKLLGRGKIDFPVKVIVESFSESAKNKIESVGGEVKTS
ncbi:MAG: uL15m family ribosomal protein [Candidatus Aenigmarchaeota archaeon]|nr:uL15 family ribosomal protein [Candidatus Aenigmarchaeota archaeon]MDW8149800.1 uL15m family ribosomal protein [Candidatus Aenigmarchaeota archaeon]